MRAFTLLACCFGSCILFGQTNMLHVFSSLGMEYGKASAIDSRNNYINGSLFQNTIFIDSVGGTSLTAPGASTQMAITKYNSEGKLIWGFEAGGVLTSESPHGIDVDAQDNIYVCGYFGNPATTGSFPADFDPNGGGTINTTGNEDIFVAKYDSTGTYQWAFGLGNLRDETQERAWDIAVDASGNSYVVGGFHGVMDFNPLGQPVLDSLLDTTAGIFMAKYNSSGLHQWHIIINANGQSVFFETYATCDLDTSGNLYVAGNFRGNQVDINPLGTTTTLNSAGQNDFFLAKYGSSGQLIWYKQVGSAMQDLVAPGALRVDNFGRPYLTGRLSGVNTVNFNPSGSPVNISNSSLFLTSFDQNGNHLNTVGMNSGTGDGGHRVGFDSRNRVYVAGWVNGNSTFGSIGLVANSNMADNFLAKYSPDLDTCHWVLSFGGQNAQANNIVAGLSVDLKDNPIITGQFYGQNANLTPLDTFNTTMSSAGANDCFIIKYDSEGKLWSSGLDLSVGLSEKSSLSIFPNPSTEMIRVEGVHPTKLQIIDTNGQLLQEANGSEVSVASLPPGVYFLMIHSTSDSTSPLTYRIVRE